MATITETVYVKTAIDTKDFTNSITGMKKEMTALKGLIGSNLLSAAETGALKARFGELKNEFDDLRKESLVSGVQMDETFGNIARLGGVAASSVGATVGIMSLLGFESKKTGEIEKQMLAAISVAQTLQQVADAKQLKTMVLVYAGKLKELLLFKSAAVLKAQEAVATETLSIAQAIQIKGVGLATKAQLVWNAVMAANPIALMIVAIAALASVLFGLYKIFGDNTKKVNEWDKAIDGTVLTNKEARDEYNKNVIALRELGIEYQLITGHITEFEAETLKAAGTLSDTLDDIAKETAKKADEAINSTWNYILTFLAGQVIMTEGSIDDMVQVYKDGNKKIDDANKQAAAVQTNRVEKLKQETVERNRETNQKIIDLKIQKLQSVISNLQQEYDAELASTKKIYDLYKSLNLKQSELSKVKLSPEASEIKTVEDFYAGVKLDITDLNKQLEDEIKNQFAVGEKIKANEKSLRQYKNIHNDINDLTKAHRQDLKDQYVEALNAYNANYLNLRKLNTSLADQEEALKNVNLGAVEFAATWALMNKDKDKRNKIGEVMQSQLVILNDLSSKISAENVNMKLNEEKRLSINKDLNDLSAEKVIIEKNILDINGKITIEKQKQADTKTTSDEDRARIDAETEVIRKKYANIRMNNIKSDELAIIKIKVASLDEIISNEKLSDKTRNNAIQERSKLLYSQSQIELALYQIKLNQIDAQVLSLQITQAEATAQKNLLIAQFEETAKVIDKLKGETVKSYKEIENLSLFYQGSFGGIYTSLSEMQMKVSNGVKITTADIVKLTLEASRAIEDVVVDSMLKNIEIAYNKSMEFISNVFTIQTDALDQMRNKELIDQEEYDARMWAYTKQKNEREADENRKKFDKEKQIAAARIILNSIISASMALVEAGPIAGIPLAAIIIGAGIAEAGIALSQKNPYAKGGIIKGNSHSNGGVPLTAEGGEFIVKKSVVQQPGMLDTLTKINNGTTSGTVNNYNNGLDRETLRTIISEVVSGVANIPVNVTETDITRTVKKVNVLESRSKW